MRIASASCLSQGRSARGQNAFHGFCMRKIRRQPIFRFQEVFPHKSDRTMVIVTMISTYPIRRRRIWNDAQVLKIADIMGDIAQIFFATFALPIFFGKASFSMAFSGIGLSLVLWCLSIYLLRVCRH